MISSLSLIGRLTPSSSARSDSSLILSSVTMHLMEPGGSTSGASLAHVLFMSLLVFSSVVRALGVSVGLEERGEVRERARELAVVAGSLGAAPDEELDQALDL